MKNQNKCNFGGCKCDPTIVLGLLWGKDGGELKCCDKHTPTWAQGQPVSTLSPIKEIFGIKKSFYIIKSKA